jgi:hypothetical protein
MWQEWVLNNVNNPLNIIMIAQGANHAEKKFHSIGPSVAGICLRKSEHKNSVTIFFFLLHFLTAKNGR